MIPALSFSASLFSWCTSAKSSRDAKDPVSKISFIIAMKQHQALVRALSCQALNISAGRRTCTLIDWSLPLVLGGAEWFPHKAQPFLLWVKRYAVGMNQAISAVAACILLARGERKLGTLVLTFIIYEMACRRRWVTTRVQSIVGRTLNCALSLHQLATSSSMVDRAFTICYLFQCIASWPAVQVFFTKKMPPIAKLSRSSLPSLENLCVNRDHIFIKDSESEYQVFLDALAKLRGQIYIEEILRGDQEIPPLLHDTLCNIVVQGYCNHNAFPFPLPFLYKYMFANYKIGAFWDSYDVTRIAEHLATHTSEGLNKWALERGIENKNGDELAKLLLIEMKFLMANRSV